MELNEIIDRKLTSEQKSRFQSDNGKFKLLKNIVIVPIVTAIVGIYLESIIIVTISIICIITFLILFDSFRRKNTVYENVIIPIVLNEKFSNVRCISKNDSNIDDIDKSLLFPEYNKIHTSNYIEINQEKYNIKLCKVITNKLHIEENDGVVDKNLEQNFSGLFASVKLPSRYENEFRVINNKKEMEDIYGIDKLNTEQIRTGNSEFDLEYDVYSMDQVSVKRILSPGAIARIMDMNKNINNIINFSVYENTLYISINYENFMEFNGQGKKYVNEEIAQENLNVLDTLDYFIRYFINMIEA